MDIDMDIKSDFMVIRNGAEEIIGLGLIGDGSPKSKMRLMMFALPHANLETDIKFEEGAIVFDCRESFCPAVSRYELDNEAHKALKEIIQSGNKALEYVVSLEGLGGLKLIQQ